MTTVPYDKFIEVFGEKPVVKWKPKHDYPRPEHMLHKKDGFWYRHRWGKHRIGTKITVFEKSETKVFTVGKLSATDIEYLEHQLLKTQNTIRFEGFNHA